MAKKIAIKAKLYIQIGGTYETPTWVEAPIIGNMAYAGAWNEVVAQTRETVVEEVARTTLPMSWSGQMKVKTDHPAYIAFGDCYHDSENTMDVMVLDGDIEDAGVEGYRAHVEVFDWSQDQATANYLFRDFVLKPSMEAPADEKPKFVQIGVTSGEPEFSDID